MTSIDCNEVIIGGLFGFYYVLLLLALSIRLNARQSLLNNRVNVLDRLTWRSGEAPHLNALEIENVCIARTIGAEWQEPGERPKKSVA